MTERQDIGARLENWGRWCNSRWTRGAQAASMTAAVCERMERIEQLGVEVSASGEPARDASEAERDALLLERGMRHLTTQHRLVLKWTYVMGARPEVVCRMVGIQVKPISVFVAAFRAAQAAIEQVVDSGKL